MNRPSSPVIKEPEAKLDEAFKIVRGRSHLYILYNPCVSKCVSHLEVSNLFPSARTISRCGSYGLDGDDMYSTRWGIKFM